MIPAPTRFPTSRDDDAGSENASRRALAPGAAQLPGVRLALPRGRMAAGLAQLFEEAGIPLRTRGRALRPDLCLDGFEVKELKPADVVELLRQGTRDLGFAGADRVAEAGLELPCLLDTGLDPVRLVAAAPAALLASGSLAGRRLRIATEYPTLARGWAASMGIEPVLVCTRGATEVFPPEDADLIVDVVQSGATLAANGLVEIDTLMRSTTRLFANAGLDGIGLEAAQRFALLLGSVLAARGRVLVELNVATERLAEVVDALPSMKGPTVADLAGGRGFAVKAAVPRADLVDLLPLLVARGATDILVSKLERVLP
ncbi:MAG: ATP phosphoribosyltransferase [Planctomycetaceae bacterium]|nr:ATP phosphoribosyltransferase [Planctomycetaceae bacterium]